MAPPTAHPCPVSRGPNLACCRRSAQTSDAGGDEKEAVKSYFNSVGFERWNKIYGTTDDINSVRRHRNSTSLHRMVCA